MKIKTMPLANLTPVWCLLSLVILSGCGQRTIEKLSIALAWENIGAVETRNEDLNHLFRKIAVHEQPLMQSAVILQPLFQDSSPDEIAKELQRCLQVKIDPKQPTQFSVALDSLFESPVYEAAALDVWINQISTHLESEQQRIVASIDQLSFSELQLGEKIESKKHEIFVVGERQKSEQEVQRRERESEAASQHVKAMIEIHAVKSEWEFGISRAETFDPDLECPAELVEICQAIKSANPLTLESLEPLRLKISKAVGSLNPNELKTAESKDKSIGALLPQFREIQQQMNRLLESIQSSSAQSSQASDDRISADANASKEIIALETEIREAEILKADIPNQIAELKAELNAIQFRLVVQSQRGFRGTIEQFEAYNKIREKHPTLPIIQIR